MLFYGGGDFVRGDYAPGDYVQGILSDSFVEFTVE